jgi:hypothetical protein
MTASDVMRVDKAEMVRVLQRRARTRRTVHHPSADAEQPGRGGTWSNQLFNSSEKRLARTLLLLANFGKEGGPQPISMPISQETLAEIVGTNPPTGQSFHEHVQEAWVHQLQRHPGDSQLPAECPC